MNLGVGCKGAHEPLLVMHRSKSSRALGKELKERAGAARATYGVARSDGETLVLEVEGPAVTGMGKLVERVLKREHLTAFKEVRVRDAGGTDESEGEGG